MDTDPSEKKAGNWTGGGGGRRDGTGSRERAQERQRKAKGKDWAQKGRDGKGTGGGLAARRVPPFLRAEAPRRKKGLVQLRPGAGAAGPRPVGVAE